MMADIRLSWGGSVERDAGVMTGMRKAVLALMAAMLAAPGLRAADEGIQWLDNYQEALREAKRTQKPIFLEFRCEA